jgi:hypothetical protein
MERWRGLKALVEDAVEHGSKAVERLQKEAARRPFDLLEQIPPLEVPVKVVREVHDTAVSSVHGMIRLVNRVAGSAISVVLDEVEQGKRPSATKADPSGGTPGEPAGSPADKAP